MYCVVLIIKLQMCALNLVLIFLSASTTFYEFSIAISMHFIWTQSCVAVWVTDTKFDNKNWVVWIL